MKLNIVKDAITRNATTALMKLKKASPEILIGVGIAGMVTTVVLACRETKKAETVLEEHKKAMETIEAATEFPEEYSDEDKRKDIFITYVQTGVKLAKVYWPAIAVGAATIACFVGSHGIMSYRNAGLVSAFNALKAEYDDYRETVKEQLGNDEEMKVATKAAERGMEKAKEDPPFATKHSRYTRYFDECSKEWCKDADYNKAFLITQQNSANDRLRAHGMLFLNEVYEMLGFEPTPEGSVVGWVWKKDHEDFVDFGIYDPVNEGNRMFVNGGNRYVLLDFNVDGVVFDLL